VDTEVLSKAVNPATVDCAMSCNNAIAEGLVKEHVVIFGPMSDEGVNFNK
jgi:hypothetical protein